MRRVLATLSTAAVLAGILVLAVPQGSTAATGFELTRLAGEDRYATAAEISVDAFPDGAADVLIATGLRFPDALAGGFLAGQLDAPLLLTATDSVPQVTIDALATLETERVTILGGPGVVSEDVAEALAGLDSTSANGGKIDVDRVAGATRYGTARAVATEDGTTAGTVDGKVTAIVGRGDAFPDTLAAGPLAYAAGLPLLLTPTDTLHADTKAALEELAVEHVLVLGGSAAVSDATESDIQDARGADSITTERLAGVNRQETARVIAEYALSTLDFSDELITLARGDKFPDALAGGPHGGVNLAPTLLTVSPTQLSPTSTTGATRYLSDHSPTLLGGVVLGGTAAVSNSVVTQAETIGAGDDSTAPVIQSAVANSASETVVLTYSENVECIATSFNQFSFTGATSPTPTGGTCDGTNKVTLRFNDVTAGGNVTYTDDSAEKDDNDVSDQSGNPADNQTIAATLTGDATAPTLVSAVANTGEDTVTATFSENVTCVDASKSQFSFQGSTPTVASCTNGSPNVTLKLAHVDPAGSKTLAYTDDDANADSNDVQDAAGNPAEDGSVEATLTGDIGKPFIQSAVVADPATVGEAIVTATYNEDVTCSTNDPQTMNQFRYMSSPPSSLVCYGRRARLEFPLVSSGSGSLSYTDDDPEFDQNDVRDSAGNPAQTQTGTNAVSASTTDDTTGPTPEGTAGTGFNETANVVVVDFAEPDGSGVICRAGTRSQFAYRNPGTGPEDGITPDAISCPSSAEKHSDRIWLYFPEHVVAGTTESPGVLTYTDDDTAPDADDLIDEQGNPAADFTENITTSVGGTGAPQIISRAIDADTDTITVNYDADVTCDDSAVARNQFSYQTLKPTALTCFVDEDAPSTMIILEFGSDITTGGTLTYTDDDADPDPNDVRDWPGNSASNYTSSS